MGAAACHYYLNYETAPILATRLDYLARIVQAIEGFGGTIKDLAGDGVLALFGAPITHEDDAERAVRAALAIVREIDEYASEVAKGWGVEGFAARVGVHSGPVVLGPIQTSGRVELGAYGDTVNTAARLQAAAQPGTVLVGASTHALCSLLFEWADRIDYALKGEAEPVRASMAKTPVAGPAALKSRGLPGTHAPLVGRERELAIAAEAVEAARAGSGGLLFVTGEAGIGKSRLLLEVRALFESGEPASGLPAGAGQPLWLEGRCVSYGESLPYWPFRDLMREWLGATPDEAELRVRVSLRRSIDRLFPDRSAEIYPYLGAMLGLALEPDAAGKLAELSPEALQYRTFEVVGTLLARLAEDRPVAVALDDLHWADATSIQLTERLFSLTEDAAVLLIVALRPERDHGSWALRDTAARTFPHRTHDRRGRP